MLQLYGLPGGSYRKPPRGNNRYAALPPPLFTARIVLTGSDSETAEASYRKSS